MAASGRDPAREREAVAAVAGDEQVVGLERVHGADRGCLLARGEVAVAADPGALYWRSASVSKTRLSTISS